MPSIGEVTFVHERLSLACSTAASSAPTEACAADFAERALSSSC